MLAEFNWIETTAGSPIFLALIVFSVVTFGIAIERAYYYWSRRGNPDATALEVMRRVRAGEIKEAIWTCENTSHPIGQVLLRLFNSTSSDNVTLEERLYVALSEQKLVLERNLNVLGTMAAIAPLVGLLGTVWGIMRAFSDMAQVGSAAPSVVAAGVAEALVTTAAGLIIAVPALILFNHFSRRMNVMLTVAENHARSVRASMNELSNRNTQGGSTGRTNDKAHDSQRPAATPETAPVS